MRFWLAVILVTVIGGGIGMARGSSAAALAGDQAAIVEAGQRAAVRAMHFVQGDAAGLRSNRGSFTDAGWEKFMKSLTGFLDEKGAPTFSSDFAASGNAVVVGEENGMIHFKIPGTLTQTSGKSVTTYKHSQLDVVAGGEPVRIARLESVYVVH